MKCPKKCNSCSMVYKRSSGKGYICSGINSKPTKWKKDIIKLCLKGEFVKGFFIEMTKDEALLISKALLNVAI